MQDYVYEPSYYITLILVQVVNNKIVKITEEAIEKAFDFCSKYDFRGHAYEAMATQISVANLFDFKISFIFNSRT